MIRQVITGAGHRAWCPNGHIDTEEDWFHFCSVCGERLNQHEIPHKELICDVCKTTSVSHEMAFCPNCGSRAEGPKTKSDWEGP